MFIFSVRRSRILISVDLEYWLSIWWCLCRSIASIGRSAFFKSGLRSVVVPTSVTFIGEVLTIVQKIAFLLFAFIRYQCCSPLGYIRLLLQSARGVSGNLLDIYSFQFPSSLECIAVDRDTHVRATSFVRSRWLFVVFFYYDAHISWFTVNHWLCYK